MENGRTYKSIDTLNYPLQKIVSFLVKMLFSFLLAPLRRVDELVSRKETIGLRGIACLHANGAPLKGVLIIGAPAIGKTSLVRWLCLGWAQGELLQHYEMVILHIQLTSFIELAKSLYKINTCKDLNGKVVYLMRDVHSKLGD